MRFQYIHYTICRSGEFNIWDKHTSKPRKVVENTSGICSYIEKSCCTTEDFKAIKKWWEGEAASADKSNQKKRLTADEDIAQFTTALIKLAGELSAVSAKVNEKKGDPSSYCKAKAKAYLSWKFYNLL